jgi:hypothetical protein
MKQTRATEHRKPQRESAPSDHLSATSSFDEAPSAALSDHRFDALNIFSNSESSAKQSAPTQGALALQPDFANSAHRPEAFGFDFHASGGGQTLEPTVQAKMEQSFGQDFSNVKIHQDGQADRLGAHAFTVGDDIYFSQTAYNPQDSAGQRLLGHELTHVVQQREDRVHAPDSGGSATVYQDAGLEQEADRMGADAAAGLSVGTASSSSGKTSGNTIQQKPVMQPAIPAALAGVLTWAGTEANAMAVGTLATIAGSAASAGSALGSAIAPGQSGVQEVQIEPWMSDADKHKLEFIIQAKLVNAYVDAWVAAHPGVNLSADQPETTSTTTTTSTTASTPNPTTAPATPGSAGSTSTTTTTATTTRDGSATASGGGVDTAIGNAVKAQVQMEVENAFNTNQKTLGDAELIWSDSGDSTADLIGTVGAIKFSQVMGSFLTYNVALSPTAQQIRGLALPLQGQSLTVKLFRGGRMHQGPSMNLGYGDSLAINLIGGGPTRNQAEPSLTFATSWRWDGNTTNMNVKIIIQSDGSPRIADVTRDSTPDDSSWF